MAPVTPPLQTPTRQQRSASRRSDLTLEQVLRSRPDFGDIARAVHLLLDEVPSPAAQAAILGLLIAAEVATTAGLALAAKFIVDDATRTGTIYPLDVALAALLAVMSVGFIAWRKMRQERLIHRCRERGVRRVARALNGARYTDLAAVPMAELRELLMTDVEFAYRFFVETIGHAVVIAVWVLATVAALLWLSPVMLLVLAGVGVVTAVVLAVGIRRHLALTGERFVRLADLSGRARDIVEVDRVLLARQLGVGTLFVGWFLAAHEAFLAVSLVQQRLSAVLRAAVLGLNSLVFLTVVVLGGSLIAAGALTAGALVAILFVLGQLLTSVAALSEYAYRAAETAKAGRRLAAYWTPDAAATRPEDQRRDERIERIDVRGVGYAYPRGRRVLDGLDLVPQRGEITAITGAIGAGKTTMALLLAGILEPDEGRIAINGDERWRPTQLAAGRVLYVGPRPILFEGSIRDNLLLNEHCVVEPHVLAPLLDELPAGTSLDTPLVGPNGTGVSSGQGQLIALARAVVRDPEVVVFDEATSAMDMRTEQRVQQALLDWCRQRVVMVISHRECVWTREAGTRLAIPRG